MNARVIQFRRPSTEDEFNAYLEACRRKSVKALLEGGQKSIKLVVAILVSKGGGRKVVFAEVDDEDGFGEGIVRAFCREAETYLKPKQILMPAVVTVTLPQLEACCNGIKFLDA